MTQDQVKLKPCPFCGSVDIRKRLDKYTDNNFYASLVCRECKAEALEDVWNQRTPAIDDCTLSLMKKCDGLEEVIVNSYCTKENSSKEVDVVLIQTIAQAIRNHLTNQ